MDGRDLASKLNYVGMEKAARKLLLDEKLSKVEDVAIMTDIEVCSKLLEAFQVVACENECITLIKNEDMATYNRIVKYLER